MVRADLQDLLVGGRRLPELLLLDEDGGQGEPRLREPRVLAGGPLQHRHRFLRASGQAQAVAQDHAVFRGQSAVLLERAQIADRGLVLAGGLVGHGAGAADHEHARVFGEEGGQLADRLPWIGPRHRHAVPAQPGDEPDAVLGVTARRRRRGRSSPTSQVSERSQALGRLCVDRRCGDGCRRGHGLLELASHLRDPGPLGGGAVLRLGGVRLEVEELHSRRLDQLEPRRAPGMQGGPSILELRVEGLGVGRNVRERLPGRRRAHGTSLHPFGLETRVVEKGRCDVDAASHHLRHPARGHARSGQDEGDSQCRIVDEDPVRILAMLAQALPVIRRHQHQGRGRSFLEAPQQSAELRVHERDLAVVGSGGPGRELGRRLVGGVGIEVVHPQEERGRGRRRARWGVEPAQDGVGGAVRGPLHVGGAPRVASAGQMVVVGQEAAVEAEPAGEREARDEGGGPITRRREVLGHAAQARRQHISTVVAHSVAQGGAAGQDRRVRWRREGHVGHCRGEPHAPRGEAVEGGGRGPGIAVTAQAIGAQRVDRHQQHVRSGRRRRSGPSAAAGQNSPPQEEDCTAQGGAGRGAGALHDPSKRIESGTQPSRPHRERKALTAVKKGTRKSIQLSFAFDC